jgi:hypothetical protein
VDAPEGVIQDLISRIKSKRRFVFIFALRFSASPLYAFHRSGVSRWYDPPAVQSANLSTI